MWTEQEDLILIENYQNKTVKQIIEEKLINKGLSCIQSRVKHLKLKKGRGKFIRSKETKIKSSISAKKRIRTPEEIEKSRLILLNYMKNNKHPCLGKTWILSEDKKQHFYGNNWHKNKPHSKETKEKMSINSKSNFTEEKREKLRQASIKSRINQGLFKPTKIEIKTANFLKEQNIEFIQQYLVSGRMLFDFYIPMCNLIIEVDGDYWHSLEKSIKRDKSKSAYLKAIGINLLRVTETEVNNDTFKEKILNRIKEKN